MRGCSLVRSMFGAALILAASQTARPAELFISPAGNDAWNGRAAARTADDGPFATFERARDEIRAIKKRDGLLEAVTVWAEPGTYFFGRALELGAEDGGSEKAPVVYRAREAKAARITGGIAIGVFRRAAGEIELARADAEARANILFTDLSAQGITNFGQLARRGFGQPVVPAVLELFFEDQPMTLARWPNEGWTTIADVPAGADGGKFTYDGDRPVRWRSSPDLWLHGLWTWDWADSYEKVASIDLEKKEIATVAPHGVYGYKKGKRFYALNTLMELDAPGEWYLDRGTGRLFFWPPAPIDAGDAQVSIGERLIVMKGAAHVSFEGFTLEQARGDAVTIEGGAATSIKGCAIRNVGNRAIVIAGGKKHRAEGCEIFDTGDGGIDMAGGARETLEPGGHEAVNNHIHHYSRWSITYRPAIMISGVGNRLANNLIHDGPHNAIQLSGNEHVIEYNEIHRVCTDTGDVGAFYMGRNWTERGNVIRYNYFHDIGATKTEVGAMAIYLDDWASGSKVYGNLCVRAGRAVLIGGGRDNLVENNVFIDCEPAIHVDSRGLGWAKNYFDGTTTTLTERLDAMNYKNPPYSERYPELLKLYGDEPAVAKGNLIRRNIRAGGRWLDLLDGLTDRIVKLEENWTEGEPGFADAAKGDYRLRDDAPARKLGIESLPTEKMGLLNAKK